MLEHQQRLIFATFISVLAFSAALLLNISILRMVDEPILSQATKLFKISGLVLLLVFTASLYNSFNHNKRGEYAYTAAILSYLLLAFENYAPLVIAAYYQEVTPSNVFIPGGKPQQATLHWTSSVLSSSFFQSLITFILCSAIAYCIYMSTQRRHK